ncbi:MAG: hypothetical protein IKI84_13380 [Clostridia bacterium]|nr:hypothetical protein [Clostridia bacterium]
MSTYENKNKVGHPVLGIVLAILGIGIAVLFTLLFGVIAGAAATILGVVAILLGMGARKGGRGIGAIVTGGIAIAAAIAMMFTTVTAMNMMHKAALETGKAPVFAECFENPYMGLSSVYFKVAGDEAKMKALTDELQTLKDYTAQNGAVTVSVSATATETKAL